jgi:hypothetical protein
MRAFSSNGTRERAARESAIVKSVINRLALPGAMAIFLLLSLAYWWLENLPHEIFGTVLFLSLAWHIFVNRFWFKNSLRGQYDTRRLVILTFHLVLAVNMVVLLLTSFVISKSAFSFLPIPDSIYLREIHWFSAYWVMVIVGVHLGLHWTRVMAMTRSTLDLPPGSVIRTLVIRLAIMLLAGFGTWSFSVLGVWTKLTFTYSLDFWDFTASVTPFFGHWAGVVALPAIITHYLMAWRRNRARTVPASRQMRGTAGAEVSEDVAGA